MKNTILQIQSLSRQRWNGMAMAIGLFDSRPIRREGHWSITWMENTQMHTITIAPTTEVKPGKPWDDHELNSSSVTSVPIQYLSWVAQLAV